LAEINKTATNQGLYFTYMFKTLNILGLDVPTLKFDGDRLVNLTIDNSKMDNYPMFDNRPKSVFSSIDATMPVLEYLTLRHIQLEDVLDFSTYTKLKEIDLLGSTTKQVILPITSSLTTVKLPNTIETLEIYNNSNLNDITLQKTVVENNETYFEEDLSNLKSVYIDGAKCKSLDVSAFCTKLLNANNLNSVILRNVNLIITEEVLTKLIYISKCDITGTIKVIDDAGSLKAISFKTKEKLVNTFGYIDDLTNDLYVQYAKAQINIVNTSTEIFVYKPSNISGNYSIPGAIILNIANGNDVNIVRATE
jgi:hypothetical protein